MNIDKNSVSFAYLKFHTLSAVSAVGSLIGIGASRVRVVGTSIPKSIFQA